MEALKLKYFYDMTKVRKESETAKSGTSPVTPKKIDATPVSGIKFRLVKHFEIPSSEGEKQYGIKLTNRKISIEDLVNNIRDGAYKGMNKYSEVPGIMLNEFGLKRQYADLKSITGWYAVDIDRGKNPLLTEKNAPLVRDLLFLNCPEVKVAFVSISGKGVKLIAHSPPPKIDVAKIRAESDAEKKVWRDHYNECISRLVKQSRVTLIIDPAQSLINQVIFMSTDAGIKFRR